MKLFQSLLLFMFILILNSCEMFTLFKQEDRLKSLLENQQVLQDVNFVNNAGWNSSGFFTVNNILDSNSSGLLLENGEAVKTSSIGAGKKVAIEIELGTVSADYYPVFYVKPSGASDFSLTSATNYGILYTPSVYADYNGWIIRYKESNNWEAIEKVPLTSGMVFHLVATSTQFIIYKNYQQTGAVKYSDLKPFYYAGVPTPLGTGTYQFSEGFFVSIVGSGTSGALIKRMKIYQLE